MIDQEDRVRALAHDIWEREGRPSGRAEAHWTMALDEVTRAAVTKPRARKVAAAAATAAPKRRAPAKANKA